MRVGYSLLTHCSHDLRLIESIWMGTNGGGLLIVWVPRPLSCHLILPDFIAFHFICRLRAQPREVRTAATRFPPAARSLTMASSTCPARLVSCTGGGKETAGGQWGSGACDDEGKGWGRQALPAR